MSKRKQKKKKSDSSKKEVHQPDDKLFKVVMEKKESAIQYLITHFPEFAEKVDLDSLEITRESFSIPNLKVFDADISYRGRFKDSEEHFHLNYLWENKSEPETYVAVQVGLYLFLRYYRMVKKTGQKLEPVIPLIFYNGKTDWVPKTLMQLFERHPFLGTFERFLPNFDFHFTNIVNYPKAELLGIENAFFRSAMVAMANKHNFDLLFQSFPVIFDLDSKDELMTMGYFTLAIIERLPEELKEIIITLPEPIQFKFMSTMDTIMSRAAEKLRIKEEEHRIEMKEYQKKIEVEIQTKNILTMYDKDKSPEIIADLLGLEEQFVVNIINSNKK